jgi:hypothetical protein
MLGLLGSRTVYVLSILLRVGVGFTCPVRWYNRSAASIATLEPPQYSVLWFCPAPTLRLSSSNIPARLNTSFQYFVVSGAATHVHIPGLQLQGFCSAVMFGSTPRKSFLYLRFLPSSRDLTIRLLEQGPVSKASC